MAPFKHSLIIANLNFTIQSHWLRQRKNMSLKTEEISNTTNVWIKLSTLGGLVSNKPGISVIHQFSIQFHYFLQRLFECQCHYDLYSVLECTATQILEQLLLPFKCCLDINFCMARFIQYMRYSYSLHNKMIYSPAVLLLKRGEATLNSNAKDRNDSSGTNLTKALPDFFHQVLIESSDVYMIITSVLVTDWIIDKN